MKLHRLDEIPEYHHWGSRDTLCDEPEPKAFALGDGRVVVVEWHLDIEGYEYVMDTLGTYTDDAQEHVVDRREGILLGEYEDEPTIYDFLPGEYHDLWDDRGPWEGIHTDGIPQDVVDEADQALDEAWDWWKERGGYKELASFLPTRRARHSYRYFKPVNTHPRSSFDVVPDNTVRELYQLYQGLMARRNILPCAGITHAEKPTREQMIDALAAWFMCHDYERAEEFNNDWWCFLFCQAYLYQDGKKVASAAVGGIESDSEEEMFAEFEQQQIEEVA